MPLKNSVFEAPQNWSRLKPCYYKALVPPSEKTLENVEKSGLVVRQEKAHKHKLLVQLPLGQTQSFSLFHMGCLGG